MTIEVRNVCKSFKDVDAVRNVSLRVESGEALALLGPNGAGKTTLVEMIEGVQIPDSGEIKILEKTWAKDEHFLRKEIGLALQETRFQDRLTVEETLGLFAGFYGLNQVRTREVLEIIQLESKRDTWVVQLSGGQRQRLALGIAILPRPQILILDEPTTGLDPNARRDLWKILEDFKSTGTTLILTTHYMEEAEFLCERIVMMDQGEILADGTLAQLLDKFGEGDLIEYVIDGSNPTDETNLLGGVLSCRWDSETGQGNLTVNSISETLPKFLDLIKNSEVSLTSLECRRRTLDDLFLAMSGRHLDE
ncbi:MAG: ABC transporter ATP-binding protein [SAR324 cluster bacterium]|jgi:ABC-2 type transport system ATP-binding protein|nr:ABC transporter ATP-binding protein [SAR324 cluster bacterium]MCH2265200.1 ABC transporter ATP-binding protein [SAR324 cluster bacterium]